MKLNSVLLLKRIIEFSSIAVLPFSSWFKIIQKEFRDIFRSKSSSGTQNESGETNGKDDNAVVRMNCFRQAWERETTNGGLGDPTAFWVHKMQSDRRVD